MIVSRPKEFRERTAIVAAKAGIKVTFQDKSLEKIREHRSAVIASERAQQAQYRILGREYQPPVVGTPVKPYAAASPEVGPAKDEQSKNKDRER
jgi:hypothetical protein